MEELLALFRAKASEIAEECDAGKEDRLEAAWADLYKEYKRLSQPARCKVCPGRTTDYDDGLVIGTRLAIEKLRGFANKTPGLCPEARTLILDHLATIPTPRTSQSRDRRDDQERAPGATQEAPRSGLTEEFLQLLKDRQVLREELAALAKRLPPKIAKLCEDMQAFMDEVG